jgi:hypothetical protein
MSTLLLLAALALPTLAAAEPTVYGAGVRVEPALSISELLARPEEWVGRTIRVEGRIGDVCPRRGCWIDIQAADEQSIRFKVDDGVIVFPLEAKGKRVSAEGVLTRIELTREEAIGWARHLAEERGEPFDEASVGGPMTLYQIQGTGAVVREAD